MNSLDELALREHADRGVEPGDEAGDGGFAGAGVAEEDHVQAHRRHGQVVFLPQLAHLDEVHEVLDVLLDLFEPDQVLQLFHQLVEIGLLLLDRGRLLLRPAAGGLHLRLVLLLEARLAAGHEVEGVEALAALAHAVVSQMAVSRSPHSVMKAASS